MLVTSVIKIQFEAIKACALDKQVLLWYLRDNSLFRFFNLSLKQYYNRY